MWLLGHLDWLNRDARHGLRNLRRSPVFTSVVIISLALGIGANTAIFSFVNVIILKKLPVPEPNRLVTFAQTDRGERSGIVLPLRAIAELSKQIPELSNIFGRYARSISLSTGKTPEWVSGEFVTGQYFETLQANAATGRMLNDEDIRNAIAYPVCVISYDLWRSEFGGDPRVVGRSVLLNGHPYSIVGVASSTFRGDDIQRPFDIVVPATRIGDFMPIFGGAAGAERLKSMSWLAPMARLKFGVSKVEVQRKLQLVLNQLDPVKKAPLKNAELLLEDGSHGFNAERAALGRTVVVLMLVVASVLVLACANLANLLLARAQARAREFAVRLSLGASRTVLMRQLVVEALLLAVAGGIAGLTLSFWIERILVTFLNTGRSPVMALHVRADSNVLLFSILLTLATVILFGLVPASQATRIDLMPTLRDESGVSGPAGRVLIRKSLVVTQIALSLAILFVAGLLTRTLKTLTKGNLGFQPDRVVALNVDPTATGYSGADVENVVSQILTRARLLPGVNTASFATSPPNGSAAISMSIKVPGYIPKPLRSDDVVSFNFISPHYFETLGQPLLRGRDFDERDTQSSAAVAIVNDKFVRHYFGSKDPVGQSFQIGKDSVEIIGVAADTRDRGMRSGTDDTVYMPEKQGPASALTILLRINKNPQQIVRELHWLVSSIDSRIPVVSVHTLDLDFEAGLSNERILDYLSTLFATLATLLAGVGLYGVLAYSIVRRTREIGVRRAIGAQRRDIVQLFARESMALVLVGLSFGCLLALVFGRALRTVLFGIAATDLPTLLSSVMVLGLAAALATFVPLLRASRVDPVVALHSE